MSDGAQARAGDCMKSAVPGGEFAVWAEPRNNHDDFDLGQPGANQGLLGPHYLHTLRWGRNTFNTVKQVLRPSSFSNFLSSFLDVRIPTATRPVESHSKSWL